MKTCYRIFLIIFLICLTSSLTSAQKQKYGYINSDELMKIMPGADSAVNVYYSYAQMLDSLIRNMQEELNYKYTEYTKNESKMSELVKQTKTKEMQDLQERIKSFQASAQEDLQKKQNEILQPIIDKAKNAIEKVAKANGYTLIFDSRQGNLLYMDPSVDIMPLVKKELGIK